MIYQNKNFKYINADEYDKRIESSVLENYVLRLWQPFLKKIIGALSAGKIIVDLGCGTGEYTQAAEDAKKIYAVDISGTMLKVCRAKLENFSQAEIIQSSILITQLPIADLVIAIGIWEYINPGSLYKKIKNITRKGSKVIVVFPNIYNDLNWMRSLGRMSPFGRSHEGKKKIALRPGFIKRLFLDDFSLLGSASFGMVFWFPKKFQFFAKPIWRLEDWFWRPFQKFLPLGINVYYLFERK